MLLGALASMMSSVQTLRDQVDAMPRSSEPDLLRPMPSWRQPRTIRRGVWRCPRRRPLSAAHRERGWR